MLDHLVSLAGRDTRDDCPSLAFIGRAPYVSRYGVVVEHDLQEGGRMVSLSKRTGRSLRGAE